MFFRPGAGPIVRLLPRPETSNRTPTRCQIFRKVDEYFSSRNHLTHQKVPVVGTDGHLSVNFRSVSRQGKSKLVQFGLLTHSRFFKSAAIGARSWSPSRVLEFTHNPCVPSKSTRAVILPPGFSLRLQHQREETGTCPLSPSPTRPRTLRSRNDP